MKKSKERDFKESVKVYSVIITMFGLLVVQECMVSAARLVGLRKKRNRIEDYWPEY